MTHVLIVEDHEAERMLLRKRLEANGYRVTAAGNGVEALAAARRDPPDAIVSDVLMPKMDGFVLCRTWMQDAGLKSIPFVFYSTTYLRREDKQFGLALGAVRYLIKPLDTEVFLGELRAVLQQRAGHAAPPPAAPLDDVTSHALHESVLARKIEDKIAQLEAANRKLLEGEEKYRRIYDNLQDVYVEATLEGTIVEVSPQVETLSRGQYKREDFIGKSVNVFYADAKYREAILLAVKQQGRAIDMESMFRNRDGSLVPCSVSATVVRGADGELKTVATLRDITRRKNAESRIAYLNRVYAMLSGINTLIVRVRDRDELFREACRIAVEEGGFRMAWIGIVDRGVMKLVPVASAGVDEELLTALKDLFSLSEGAPPGYATAVQAIREKRAFVSNDLQDNPTAVFGKKYVEAGVRSMVVLPLIVLDEVAGVLVLYASEVEFFHEGELKLLTELAGDIAFAIDHIEKQARLDYLAYYDVLTGLANRNLFLDRVAQYMRSAVSGGHKLALFLTDLERFKNINDSLGRPAGDELLRQVAKWLTGIAGDVNLVARVGADVFAVVLPEVRQGGDLARMLEKMIKAFLEHPFHLTDSIFRISAKGGVSLFPNDGADADTLFKNAEVALKKAKASGERYLFYTQTMTEAVAGKLTLENQLRQALDRGEFVLHYQPKVNLVSGKVTSAEALIRWNDPRAGLVPPDRFIPILEETGLIYDVGRWALKKAIEDYLRWRAAGLAAVRIAVNVSPLQLRNRGFIAEIGQAIGIDAHAPAGLELEITESLIMEDVKHNIASLQAIRAMGVAIAIDDFGTGFSSLSYLAKLPVDTLKIDRSFVIDMTAGPQGLALVSTIIKLAHSLKLKVVAEGVETEEQSRLLRLLSCDEMQGFLFSQPVPAGIFETKFLAPPPAG